MRGIRVVLAAGIAGGTAVGVACGGDDEPAPMTYPVQGEGGPSSSTSSSSGSTTSSSGSTPTTKTLCTAVNDYFDGYAKCCSAYDKTTFDYASLITGMKPLFAMEYCDRIDGSIKAGRLRASGLTGCLDAIEALVAKQACPMPEELQDYVIALVDVIGADACGKAYTGLVTQGGACRGTYECADGLACVGWTKSSDGTCAQPPAAGEHCAGYDGDGGGFAPDLGLGGRPLCASGAYCEVLQGYTCRATKMDGEACVYDQQCTSPSKCTLGKCGADAPPGGQGAACVTSSDCNFRFKCDCRTTPGCDASVCNPKVQMGEPCEVTANCAGGHCDQLSDGGGTHTCQPFCGLQ